MTSHIPKNRGFMYKRAINFLNLLKRVNQNQRENKAGMKTLQQSGMTYFTWKERQTNGSLFK